MVSWRMRAEMSLAGTTIILPMMATLTHRLDTPGFLSVDYVTPASAGSRGAGQFALVAPCSSSSLSSAPHVASEAQLAVNAGLLETRNPAVAEQPLGGA